MAEKKADVTPIPVEPKPNRTVLAPIVVSVLDRAKSLVIRTDADYESAAEFLKTVVKAGLAEVDAAHDPVVKHWHAKHKAALKEKAADGGPFEQAEMIVKRLIAEYLRAKQLLDQQRADREKREFEEKIRAQAEEENMRRAEELLAFGDLEAASAAVDAPVVVPDIPVNVVSSAPKVSGIGLRQIYSARVTDLAALVLAVCNGEAPLESIEANQVFLNGQARQFGKTRGGGRGGVLLYDGVMIVATDNVAAGRE